MTAVSGLRVRGLQHQRGHRSPAEVVRIVFAEFVRAMAAEQRYAELRRGHVTAEPGNLEVAADIPRRLYEEYYSSSI